MPTPASLREAPLPSVALTRAAGGAGPPPLRSASPARYAARVRTRSLALVAVAIAVAASSAPTDASAYCRSTTCKKIDACDAQPVDGCAELAWTSGCTGYSVSLAGGPNLDPQTVSLLADVAFDTWKKADCGGGKHPGFVAQNLGPVECDAVEYNKHAANANVILFNGDWEHEGMANTYGLTTTTFDPETGELIGADIELNANVDFTVSDEDVRADLLSVLTHEVGHFLGMGHADADHPEATMYPYYSEGTAELRSLTEDDVAGICAIYPPREDLDETCNPLPRHGFSPQCRDDQTEGDCTIAEVGSASSERIPLGALAVLGAALIHAARRRTPGRRFTARSGERSRSRTR